MKATILFTAGPVLAFAAARMAYALRARAGLLPRLGALGAAAILTAAIATPYVRLLRADGGQSSKDFVYPILGEWDDRATNLLRSFAHHLPGSPDLVRRLGIPQLDSRSWPGVVLRPREDYVGNPAHLALLAALVVLLAVRWRRLSSLARWSAGAGMCAWVLLHVMLRDNIWLSRMQTPLFVVVPALLAGAVPSPTAPHVPHRGSFRRGKRAQVQAGERSRTLVRWAVSGAAGLVFAYGYSVALGNKTRPPLGSPLWAGSREGSYYVLRANVRAGHDRALALAQQIGCRRIGLYIEEDSYDYPLTWRAMERGMEVRHVFFDTDGTWPCVTLSDRGPPPSGPGGEWIQDSPQVFVRAAAVQGRG